MHYWYEQDLVARLHAKNQGIGYQALSAFGLFSSPLTVTSTFFGIPRAASFKGREMDVAHLLFGAATLDASQRFNFGQTVGAQSSHLEGAVPEQLFGRPYGQGVSAVRLLNEANEQGIPIYVIDEQNAATALPLLQISASARADIANAIAAGKTVIVSKRAPAHFNYTGLGYIIQDPVDGTGAYLINGGLNGGALPDCACERVKVPKAQAVYYLIASLIILALLALLIAETGGLGGAAIPAALAILLRLFGIPALFFSLNQSASAATPPACCITRECGKLDLFRGGNASSPQLEKVRLNRGFGIDDDVGFTIITPTISLPIGVTCMTATPDILAGIEVTADGRGVSLDETPRFTYNWKLPKDVYPSPQLCLMKDGPTHWSLAPRSNMIYNDFCNLLKAMNPLLIKVP